MEKLIQKHLASGNENLSLEEFSNLAQSGETTLIERKSIKEFRDIKNNKESIVEKLGKASSAFVNHSGGILLIGVNDQGQIEKGIPNQYGHGTVKEWLENVVATSTSPPLSNYEIKIIEEDKNHYLFAIFYGQSELGPHQAAHGKYNHKYFSRISGRSEPIDGILVKDIFNRQKEADISPILTIQKINSEQSKGKLFLKLINNSSRAAEKIITLVKFSDSIINGSAKSQTFDYSGNQIQANTEICYPQILTELFKKGINLKKFKEPVHCSIIIAAKNMPKKEFSFVINQNFEVSLIN